MPNPLLDYGDNYWCSFHLEDIEPDDVSCDERSNEDKMCMSCPYCGKQRYKIITKDERFKEFL